MVRSGTVRNALLAGAIIGLGGCAADADVGSVAVGERFPDYAAPNLDGDTVAIQELRGDVVVLNVWATWCPPCRREMPGLEGLHEEFADEGLRLVGVSIDGGGSEAQIRAFLDEVGVTYTILHDPGSRITRLLGMSGIPQTFLIDRDGRTIRHWFGEIDPMAEEIKAPVRDALGIAASG